MKTYIKQFFKKFLRKTGLYQSENMTHEEFVNFCYQIILGRSADIEGQQNYTHLLKSRQLTRERFLQILAESEEYQLKVQSINSTPIETVGLTEFTDDTALIESSDYKNLEPVREDENNNSLAFLDQPAMSHEKLVEFCEQFILDKQMAQEARSNILQQLEMGLCKPDALLLKLVVLRNDLSTSIDAQGLDLMDDQDYLELAYHIILGRSPDEMGQAHYIQALNSRQLSRQELLMQLVNSEEYQEQVILLQNRKAFLSPELKHILKTLSLPGIELNLQGQLQLLQELKRYYNEFPFSEWKTEELRYYFAHPAYSYADGLILYSMIRHFKPRKIIDIRAGFASSALLDINQLFFEGTIELTLTEPLPGLLEPLRQESESTHHSITLKKEIDLEDFTSLQKNDILFIESGLISTVSSEENQIFFEILPVLKPGVIIHFYDVFWPFEYPQKSFWKIDFSNEIYVLRAFLQFNPHYEILSFYSYLYDIHPERIQQYIPEPFRKPGSSFWLRRV